MPLLKIPDNPGNTLVLLDVDLTLLGHNNELNDKLLRDLQSRGITEVTFFSNFRRKSVQGRKEAMNSIREKYGITVTGVVTNDDATYNSEFLKYLSKDFDELINISIEKQKTNLESSQYTKQKINDEIARISEYINTKKEAFTIILKEFITAKNTYEGDIGFSWYLYNEVYPKITAKNKECSESDIIDFESIFLKGIRESFNADKATSNDQKITSELDKGDITRTLIREITESNLAINRFIFFDDKHENVAAAANAAQEFADVKFVSAIEASLALVPHARKLIDDYLKADSIYDDNITDKVSNFFEKYFPEYLEQNIAPESLESFPKDILEVLKKLSTISSTEELSRIKNEYGVEALKKKLNVFENSYRKNKLDSIIPIPTHKIYKFNTLFNKKQDSYDALIKNYKELQNLYRSLAPRAEKYNKHNDTEKIEIKNPSEYLTEKSAKQTIDVHKAKLEIERNKFKDINEQPDNLKDFISYEERIRAKQEDVNKRIKEYNELFPMDTIELINIEGCRSERARIFLAERYDECIDHIKNQKGIYANKIKNIPKSLSEYYQLNNEVKKLRETINKEIRFYNNLQKSDNEHIDLINPNDLMLKYIEQHMQDAPIITLDVDDTLLSSAEDDKYYMIAAEKYKELLGNHKAVVAIATNSGMTMGDAKYNVIKKFFDDNNIPFFFDELSINKGVRQKITGDISLIYSEPLFHFLYENIELFKSNAEQNKKDAIRNYIANTFENVPFGKKPEYDQEEDIITSHDPQTGITVKIKVDLDKMVEDYTNLVQNLNHNQDKLHQLLYQESYKKNIDISNYGYVASIATHDINGAQTNYFEYEPNEISTGGGPIDGKLFHFAKIISNLNKGRESFNNIYFVDDTYGFLQDAEKFGLLKDNLFQINGGKSENLNMLSLELTKLERDGDIMSFKSNIKTRFDLLDENSRAQASELQTNFLEVVVEKLKSNYKNSNGELSLLEHISTFSSSSHKTTDWVIRQDFKDLHKIIKEMITETDGALYDEFQQLKKDLQIIEYKYLLQQNPEMALDKLKSKINDTSYTPKLEKIDDYSMELHIEIMNCLAENLAKYPKINDKGKVNLLMIALSVLESNNPNLNPKDIKNILTKTCAIYYDSSGVISNELCQNAINEYFPSTTINILNGFANGLIGGSSFGAIDIFNAFQKIVGGKEYTRSPIRKFIAGAITAIFVPVIPIVMIIGGVIGAVLAAKDLQDPIIARERAFKEMVSFSDNNAAYIPANHKANKRSSSSQLSNSLQNVSSAHAKQRGYTRERAGSSPVILIGMRETTTMEDQSFDSLPKYILHKIKGTDASNNIVEDDDNKVTFEEIKIAILSDSHRNQKIESALKSALKNIDHFTSLDDSQKNDYKKALKETINVYKNKPKPENTTPTRRNTL